ncbi:MAG: 2-dehydropantoate 2-reductase [Negativicutes bacterium]|nr:2-dehydropantoate 2-reductase [Negativicutes bacterium]
MKIAIIGAGALGCLYGGYLARKGRHEVWLYDVVAEQVKVIGRKGLSIVSPEEAFVANPRATSNINDIGNVDLVIVCVKSHNTLEAAMAAQIVSKPSTPVLTLQNGLGNAEKLAEVLGAERVLVGAGSMGAVILEPGHIMHRGIRRTHIAAWNGCPVERINKIRDGLEQAGLPVVVQESAASLLWSRVAIHAGINAVTAITRVTNGQLLDIAHARQLAEMAVAEVENVARAAGVRLLYENPVADMHAFAASLKDHRSSMLQDVCHKRKTEVEAINGMVVQEGLRLGVPVCVNQALVLALTTIETLYLTPQT